MDDGGDFIMPGSQYHGDCNEPAFGKHYIWLITSDETQRFSITLDDAERVRKVLDVKIPAQLTRGYAVIGNTCIFNKLASMP